MFLSNAGYGFKWDEESGENYLELSNNGHRVYYPTPRSLQLRTRLAERFSAGLSIWELGQGINCLLNEI
jgi:spore germination protein YaaH